MMPDISHECSIQNNCRFFSVNLNKYSYNEMLINSTKLETFRFQKQTKCCTKLCTVIRLINV